MSGFVPGTLVHTPRGLVPIEAVVAGGEVLVAGGAVCSVLRNVRREAQPIGLVRLWTKERGAQELLTTSSQRFWVGGYQNDGRFSDEYFAELDKPIGFIRAASLQSHQLVDVVGGTMRASSFDRIWRTRVAGEGWIEVNPDSTAGRRVRFAGAKLADRGTREDTDFLGVIDFLARNDTPEQQHLWGFPSVVHDLEIDGAHEYCAGEHGARVHDATSAPPPQ
jgi:hypothetical protein